MVVGGGSKPPPYGVVEDKKPPHRVVRWGERILRGIRGTDPSTRPSASSGLTQDDRGNRTSACHSERPEGVEESVLWSTDPSMRGTDPSTPQPLAAPLRMTGEE